MLRHRFRDALADLAARHILIPPRTPRWNRKVERFFRTLDTEWAPGSASPRPPGAGEIGAVAASEFKAGNRYVAAAEPVRRGGGSAMVVRER